MIDADDTPRRWDAATLGPMDEAAVRAHFQPADRYRFVRRRLEAGEDAGGSMIAGVVFVLAGAGGYTFGDRRFELTAGDIVRLPGGSYDVHASEDVDFEVLIVFELPRP
jgi:mannose-6-phosphate isomerase-like protein (cupin superfamily)